MEEEGKEESQVKDQVYAGESSRCVVTRTSSHLTDYHQTMAKNQRRKGREVRGEQEEVEVGEEAKLSSFMADHSLEVHEGKEVDFDFHVTGRFTKCLYRQVDEADRIQVAEEKGEVVVGKARWKVGSPLLNRKHEYYAPRSMNCNFSNSGRVRESAR